MSQDFTGSERRLAQNPAAFPIELLRLAQTYPREVLENPALPLIALEDPAMAAAIRARAARARYELRLKLVERCHVLMSVTFGVVALIAWASMLLRPERMPLWAALAVVMTLVATLPLLILRAAVRWRLHRLGRPRRSLRRFLARIRWRLHQLWRWLRRRGPS
jgi:hypothetical protein